MDPLNIVFVCKICETPLSLGVGEGLVTFIRHRENLVLLELQPRSGQTIIGRTENGVVYSFKFNKIIARRETFVEELPFVKVEKPTFHRWIKMAFGPQFKPPCRSTMRSDVMLSFQEERSALKDILRSVPGKVCLTSDLWTSNQKLGYMCITAHFITKDWKLHKRVLSFPVLPAPHTGRAISDAMYANLLSWGICDRIGTITLDNASNNDSAVSQLKDKFFGDATLSRELCHLRCTAHVMNLIVKAGLKHVEVSLNNIRESVKHLKSSQGKMEKFFENCKSLNMKTKRLPVDIPTRWNSTFIMLRDAIPYQKVIDLFFYGEEYANTPTLADWKNAVAIRDLFKVYQDATKLFSGSQYVTSSAFCYQLSKILLVLKKCDSEPAFKPMYTSMRKKYDRYWKDVPLVLGPASCMDPPIQVHDS
ncbi:hypothetical protein IFM89_017382 [Coptis chinensis]|uniref:hAT-like transposase RNase-H fold domain-containing protein n=1 Tax=Coptis chinensis TaxID=261450 RepID=A0A835HMY0_9MAGN|nr:hypothetical protein IFM89_017382 [Coptis chinensis]